MNNNSSQRENSRDGSQGTMAAIVEVVARAGRIVGPFILLIGSTILTRWLSNRRND